jgi:hypothetical protein
VAYDPLLNATILFGGYSPSDGALGATWELRGGTWTDLTPTLTISPPARWEPAFAYDPALGSLVLFGGRNYSEFLNDTWKFNASGWSQVRTPTAPSPRTTSLAYVPNLGVLFAYGGGSKPLNSPGSDPWTYYADTWEFSAAGWVNLTASLATSPPPDAMNVVYDAADGYIFLYGGAAGASPCNPRAFEWTFANGVWTNRTADAASGPGGSNGIYGAGMTFDTDLNEVVLFGGVTGNATIGCSSTDETWTYAGGTWTNLTGTTGPASPGSRQSFSMTYDSADGYALFFGGNLYNSGDYYNDTWAIATSAGVGWPTTFSETCLPAGSAWTVTATDVGTQAATTGNSMGPSITLQLMDGEYTWSASGPTGYHLSLSPPPFSVYGGNSAPLSVAFTAPGPSPTALTTLPPLVSGLLVLFGVVAGLAGVWGYTRYQYASRREEAEEWFREFRSDRRADGGPPRP